jgi:hypothetical protein
LQNRIDLGHHDVVRSERSPVDPAACSKRLGAKVVHPHGAAAQPAEPRWSATLR